MKVTILETPYLTIMADPGHKKKRIDRNITHLLGDFIITEHGMTWEAERVIVERKTELDGIPVKPYLVYHV